MLAMTNKKRLQLRVLKAFWDIYISIFSVLSLGDVREGGSRREGRRVHIW